MAGYFNALRRYITQAYDDKLLPSNPSVGIDGYKFEPAAWTYLTKKEVSALSRTSCDYPSLKRLFLFCCFSGLRIGECLELTWHDVRQTDDGVSPSVPVKAKSNESSRSILLSASAVEYMGTRGRAHDHLFGDFTYWSGAITQLKLWALKAKILKPLTFDSARVTFAMMELGEGYDLMTLMSHGVDLDMVRKLLQHGVLQPSELSMKVSIDEQVSTSASSSSTVGYGRGPSARP